MTDVKPILPAMAIRRAMTGRDIDEAHRASSPLELLFDLSTVVAVSAAAARLHEGLAAGEVTSAASTFLLSFFVIWWPWMSYTWFASAYDTDDVQCRIATAVQIIGVLLIAVGMPHIATGQTTGLVGFSVMRFGLGLQWTRAAIEHTDRRMTCLRYAAGIGLLQLLWIANILCVPKAWQLFCFFPLVMLELALPIWAARAGETPWHPHHIAERYGLLTIILLGECMVAAASAIGSTLEAVGWSMDLAVVCVALVGLILGLWWAYFLVPFAQVLQYRRARGFVWGYGHAAVFAALTVLGGVLHLVADALGKLEAPTMQSAGTSGTVTPLFAIGLAAGTVTTFFAALWWLGGQTTQRGARSFAYVLPMVLAACVAVATVAGGLPLSWGLLLLSTGPAFMVGWVVHRRHRLPEAFTVR